MASFTCRCGHVTVNFATTSPRTNIECCCVDCFQKLAWAEGQGGPAPPLHLKKREKPLNLQHWVAKFSIGFDKTSQHKEEEKLAFYKLREDATSTFCVAPCCHTVLLTDHVVYGKKIVLIFPELLGEISNYIPPTIRGKVQVQPNIRIYIRDFPQASYQKLLPKLPGMYEEADGTEGFDLDSTMSEEEASLIYSSFGAAFSEGIPNGLPGLGFHECLQQYGDGIVNNLNLPKDPASYR